MDPRRLLTLALASLTLGGCALLKPAAARPGEVTPAVVVAPAPPLAPPPSEMGVQIVTPAPDFATMAPIPNPGRRTPRATVPIGRQGDALRAAPTGRSAILAANLHARAASQARDFQGGLQIFSYEPGRVFEVWTAPLRVTTLTLAPGDKAAGDTVRWQIGETTSGDGAGQRAHIMIKPLRAGLETNLALTTNRRLYLLQLRSGSPTSFNAAIAWDVAAALDAVDPPSPPAAGEAAPALVPAPRALDGRYAIKTKGRRPAWTPVAVMTDGVRTYVSLPARATSMETPALFAVDPNGEAQMVNYRQEAGLWVVDRVLQRAELRLGGRRPQVVRIEREGGAS